MLITSIEIMSMRLITYLRFHELLVFSLPLFSSYKGLKSQSCKENETRHHQTFCTSGQVEYNSKNFLEFVLEIKIICRFFFFLVFYLCTVPDLEIQNLTYACHLNMLLDHCIIVSIFLSIIKNSLTKVCRE